MPSTPSSSISSDASSSTTTTNVIYEIKKKDKKFDSMFTDLLAFLHEQGHFQVSKIDNPDLYNWMRNLRQELNSYNDMLRKSHPLSPDQKKMAVRGGMWGLF